MANYGSSTAGGYYHEEWLQLGPPTPILVEYPNLGRNPDGTPICERLYYTLGILRRYYTPHPPNAAAAAAQQHRASANTTTIHRPPVLLQDGATKVVRLTKMLSRHDRLQLQDEEFYQDLLEEVTEEARKFGNLVKVVIPRPGPSNVDQVVAGVGKVFLEYACLDSSIHCRTRLDGRWFGGRQIVAGFFPEDKFAAGDYGYDGYNG